MTPIDTNAGSASSAASEADSGARKIAELASDIHVAMLTTVDADHNFVSRPMGRQAVDFDGTLWFYAERDSRKVAHIKANSYVNVTLASNDTWISISGRAHIVSDRQRAHQLWNGWVAAWLPQGPDDPSVVLIAVEGETAEYWDSPGGRIATVISLVKSKLTGQRYEGGDNEVVELP